MGNEAIAMGAIAAGVDLVWKWQLAPLMRAAACWSP